ncbi:unnamed protein product [Clonostachys byssicola]|uniref:Heterokaryon incompatibility domain-containing protein n=1 Tax=Clonostachys byssicola TaxID=160290 RepID=A0A9N9UHG6_9HYPO|nr:unnamed protein product [Clonostachys byssicola]
MRLLRIRSTGAIVLEYFDDSSVPPYAILSHTWGPDDEEVNFRDIQKRRGQSKDGYRKLEFCGQQAASDGLRYFWVDTCCIDKSSSEELGTAIRSMYRWYTESNQCYVYLADVEGRDSRGKRHKNWEYAFRNSRWFTRGWTLQELIAPDSVTFFFSDGVRLGSKGGSLQKIIREVTGIPKDVLRGGGTSVSAYSIQERCSWYGNRQTKKEEDEVYSQMGILDTFIINAYGEGKRSAWRRLNFELAGAERLEKVEKKLEEQKREDKKHQVLETSSAKSQQLLSLASSDPTPATSLQKGPQFSLSLCGSYFALDGPEYNYQNCMGDYYAAIKNHLNALCFLVCGTNGSWIYKYRTAAGGYYVKWSGNLSTEYPFLLDKLRNEMPSREPLLISLGPNQTFYSKWDNYNWWKVPTSITNKIQEVMNQGITAVALGMDESYVIVHGNRWSWDLKGNYNGLREALQGATSAPRAVALNSQNSTDYLLLMGSLGYRLTGGIGNEYHGNFLNWKNRNGV